MPALQRGEVWLIDFGLAGKARPALVVSVACGDRDRALITVVPHTTSLRGSPFEIAVRVPFLKPGAFLVQGVTTFPTLRGPASVGHSPAAGVRKGHRRPASLGWDIFQRADGAGAGARYACLCRWHPPLPQATEPSGACRPCVPSAP